MLAPSDSRSLAGYMTVPSVSISVVVKNVCAPQFALIRKPPPENLHLLLSNSVKELYKDTRLRFRDLRREFLEQFVECIFGVEFVSR